MYATLVRALDTWRSIAVSEFEARYLRELKEQINENDPR